MVGKPPGPLWPRPRADERDEHDKHDEDDEDDTLTLATDAYLRATLSARDE